MKQTTEEIRNRLRNGDYWDGAIIFGLKDKEWGDKQVHKMFLPDKVSESDEDSIPILPKTYREYLLILAEDDNKILARLVMQDKDTNIRTVLKAPELEAIVKLIGVDNVYNLEDALRIRDEMMPIQEESYGL